jgi:hypothetical protein
MSSSGSLEPPSQLRMPRNRLHTVRYPISLSQLPAKMRKSFRETEALLRVRPRFLGSDDLGTPVAPKDLLRHEADALLRANVWATGFRTRSGKRSFFNVVSPLDEVRLVPLG